MSTAPIIKSAWKSKLLWVNGLSFLAFVAGLVAQQAGALHIPAEWVTVIGIGLASVNFLLRMITTTALGKPETEPEPEHLQQGDDPIAPRIWRP